MMKFVPSGKNIGVNQSGFGSYLWVSFFTTSVCRFLFCYVLVCGVLLYSLYAEGETAEVADLYI